MFKNLPFITAFTFFVLFNSWIYLFVVLFHGALPFNTDVYTNQSHHYFQDSRMNNEGFILLRNIAGWDAQWYLRIADDGYPKELNQYMGALTYAFFPLYPLLLYLINFIFHNIELTAFILTNMLLVANFFSLYYVGTKLYSSQIALRATLLLYFFPFSIFFRSYFTEGLFLLLLIWFSYFLIQKRWFLSTIFLSLLLVTRPNGPFIAIVFFFFLYRAIRAKKLSIKKAIFYTLLSTVFFQGWLFFCYLMTGRPFYWYEVQSVWYHSSSVISPLVHNLTTIVSFFSLPLHGPRESRIEVIMILFVLFLLIKSRKWLKPELWWISLIIWIMPLLFKDTMSYSRFQSISFPLFLYLGAVLTGWKFGIVSMVLFILLFIASLYFINWYWVG